MIIAPTAHTVAGSSPRMRGAHFLNGMAIRGSKDHPRGCGEHPQTTITSMDSMGSSPRMRGAHKGGYLAPGVTRIIPADAGSTR